MHASCGAGTSPAINNENSGLTLHPKPLYKTWLLSVHRESNMEWEVTAAVSLIVGFATYNFARSQRALEIDNLKKEHRLAINVLQNEINALQIE
jgi:hypothetical protein